MVKKNLLLTTALLTLYFQTVAAPRTSVVEVLRGEKWWGVFAGGQRMMPFSEPFGKTDVADWTHGRRIPMLISSAGRYIWSAEPFTVEFTGDRFIFESGAGEVAAVSAGKTLREAYLICCHRNFPPTGHVPSPELFLRPVYDTRSELGFEASGDAIVSYARQILSNGYPAGTLLVASGWQNSTGDFIPSPGLYPDFTGTIRTLHEMGFNVMLTVTPMVSADGSLFRRYYGENFWLGNTNGLPELIFWDGGISACYDLARTQVADVIRQRLDSLRAVCGVDGFLFDASEVLPTLSEQGDRGEAFMQQWSRLGEGLEFCQYTAYHSKGFTPCVIKQMIDLPLEWGALSPMVSAAVTAGLLGDLYTSPVIGRRGFDLGPEDAEVRLLVRYMQLTAILPVMNIPFAPWHLSANEATQCRRVVDFRMRISEYIAQLAAVSAKTAEPLLRHMEYEFPRQGFTDCDDQFMIGNRYLVAPVYTDLNRRTVRFPRGNWVDTAGKRYKGPLVTTVNVPDGQPLIFEAAK